MADDLTVTARERYLALYFNSDHLNPYSLHSTFYSRAWRFCCILADGTPYPAAWWARAVAALSPLKSWESNQHCALNLRKFLASLDYPRGRDLMDVEFPTIGAMGNPTVNALRALAFGAKPTGLKTGAFAACIEGDLRQVCIDRHMARAGGLDTDSPTATQVFDLQNAVLQAAEQVGEFPAVFQALVWGWWRDGKGYKPAQHKETT